MQSLRGGCKNGIYNTWGTLFILHENNARFYDKGIFSQHKAFMSLTTNSPKQENKNQIVGYLNQKNN